MSDLAIGPTRASNVHGVHDTAGAGDAGDPADASPPTLLPPPVDLSGGDPTVALAILLTKSDSEDRKSARKVQTDAITAEAKADADEVHNMRQKADDVRAQGWAEGLFQIGAGVCEGAGGFADAGGAKVTTAVLKGSATALGASGKLVGAQFSADGIQRDADAHSAAATSKAEARIYQQGQEDEKDARAARDKVADFLKTTLEARNATLHAASNMRG